MSVLLLVVLAWVVAAVGAGVVLSTVLRLREHPPVARPLPALAPTTGPAAPAVALAADPEASAA